MMKIAMSPAAGALLRALIARSGVDRNRILLTDVHSTDWQSLTFTGERHHIGLRVTGAGPAEVVQRMCGDLADAEFSIPGVIVADVALVGTPAKTADGAIQVMIEALTVSDD